MTDHPYSTDEPPDRLRLLQDIVDTVEASIFVVDDDDRYRFMNQRARELLDLPDDEVVVGKSNEELFSEALAAQFRENNQRVFDSGEPTEITQTIPIGGRMRTYLTRITPLFDDAGAVYACCGIATDITEREQRETELQAKNDRLETFASVVSHDLRNPLNVAQGRVQLAQTQCESEHLGIAMSAHERMNMLIEDLLTLARTGTDSLDVEPIGFRQVVESSWRQVPTTDAALVVNTDDVVWADESRMQQLFENLFRNAIEHGGENITVTVGKTEDGFFVADDGPGIPADERSEVFDQGYTTSDGGTGFGLYIVKQIAEDHGWSCRLRESAQGGAQFEFTEVLTEVPAT